MIKILNDEIENNALAILSNLKQRLFCNEKIKMFKHSPWSSWAHMINLKTQVVEHFSTKHLNMKFWIPFFFNILKTCETHKKIGISFTSHTHLHKKHSLDVLKRLIQKNYNEMNYMSFLFENVWLLRKSLIVK